jgi:hypothetical protein
MAENETTQDEQTAENEGSGARTAVKAAAAAAATGAAAMAVRKALSGSNGESKNGKGKSGGGATGSQGSGSGSLITSIASGGWEAARDALLPLAEDAAGAVGTYVAKNGPDIVREKIVPKFISSFNDARKED